MENEELIQNNQTLAIERKEELERRSRSWNHV
jgi:hypothetical protein